MTARAIGEGFAFQGEVMKFRRRPRGETSTHLPPTAFISFIQNHDQIGNRALGDRMITYRPLETIKAVTAIYLLSPQIPMLFMGEEWGARERFPYFCDFDEELNAKVRKGRREELSRLPGFDSDDLFDPTDQLTFEMAKLDWSQLACDVGTEMLAFYKSLLTLRQERIVPLLAGVGGGSGSYRHEGRLTMVDWTLAAGSRLHLRANLSDKPATIPSLLAGERIYLLGSASDNTLSPWSVFSGISPAGT